MAKKLNYEFVKNYFERHGELSKMSFDFVKKFFEDRNYKLLENNYINSTHKMLPMDLTENIVKHDSYSEKDFKKWLKSKGIMI